MISFQMTSLRSFQSETNPYKLEAMSSEFCLDEDFWNINRHKCERCETILNIRQGYEFNPNCGRDDYGGWVQTPYRECEDGTFNDGTFLKCQKCSSCSSSQLTRSPCTATSDTQCCKQGEQIFCTTPSPPVQSTELTTSSRTSVFVEEASTTFETLHPNIWSMTGILPICVGILFILILVCLILLIRRKKTNYFNEAILKTCCNGAIKENQPYQSITQSISYNIVKESSHNGNVTKSSRNLIAPEVQAAPLKTVLNNLDVLQELVLVLDPDISGAKNTRHLASQCSFTFAWINYAYSMKDHKSPLVAVLEGVVTKHPDWNVGHLAELLTGIGRNDAVEILAKLPGIVED